MKHVSKLIKGAGLMFLMIAGMNTAQAQTTVDLSYGYDSSWSGYCNLPVHIQYGGGGNTTGYNYLIDDMDIQVFWGDGNDTSFSVPLYNNVLSDYFYFSAGHNYTSPGTFTITVVATGVDGNDDTLSYGPLLLSATCNTLQGNMYYDNNSNCVFDGGDVPLQYMNVAAVDPLSGNYVAFGYTDANGYYSFNVPSGFAINLVPNAYYPSPVGYMVSCPAAGQYSFTTTVGTSTYDFAFDCTNGAFDLQVYGYGWGLVPGNTGYVHGDVWNWGCNPVSGSVTVTSNNSDVTFTGNGYGINPAPNSFTSNTATYNFTNLSAGITGYFWNSWPFIPEIEIDTTAMIGDSVCFTFVVTPTSGDANPANNTFTICQGILASWDPNMKTVYPAGEGVQGYVAPNTTFTYTVHFQNTGSYPAADIFIIDTIDTDLNMSTFEILGSSHAMTPYFYSGNRVKFDFPNINLIDSTANEPLSHGWVTYRIKSKSGLTDGTPIENTAHIFFDYNPAVVTNTTLNTIDISLNVNEMTVMENTIYPNPVSDVVNVNFNQNVSGMVQVRDISGRIVYSRLVSNTSQFSVDVANWNTGMYEISVAGSQLSNQRFVVAR